MKTTASKVILSMVVIAVLALVAWGIYSATQKKTPAPEPIPEPVPVQSIAMCYQYSKLTNRGLYDRAWLQMELTGAAGSKVTGEYQNLPAEKDSKVGTFSGTVGPMDPKISARTADVWWDSMAEGMRVTEQLKIQFGEGSAVALFGAMKDRGDGTYVYEDGVKLTPGFQMSQVDCEQLKKK